MKKGVYATWAMVACALSSSALVVACSSDDSSDVADSGATNDAGPALDASGPDAVAASDAGSGDDASTLYIKLGLPDGGTACFPEALPTTSNGETTCRVAEIVADGGCSAAGLGPLDAKDTERVAASIPPNGFDLDAGALCEIDQLLPSACAADGGGGDGFCWVQNGVCPGQLPSDAGVCAQTLCPSGSVAPASGTTLVMICDGKY